MFGVACDSRIPQVNLHVVFNVVHTQTLVGLYSTGTVVQS
jgi:hypothetical protein